MDDYLFSGRMGKVKGGSQEGETVDEGTQSEETRSRKVVINQPQVLCSIPASELFKSTLPIQYVTVNCRKKTSKTRMAAFNVPEEIQISVTFADVAEFQAPKEEPLHSYNSIKVRFPLKEEPNLRYEGSGQVAFMSNVLDPLVKILKRARNQEGLVEEKAPLQSGKKTFVADFQVIDSSGKIRIIGEAKPWDYLLDFREKWTTDQVIGDLETCDDPSMGVRSEMILAKDGVEKAKKKKKTKKVGTYTGRNFMKGIKQLATYMLALDHKMAFGILTTYIHTYLTVLDRSTEVYSLKVSRALKHNGKNIHKHVYKFIELAFQSEVVQVKSVYDSIGIEPIQSGSGETKAKPGWKRPGPSTRGTGASKKARTNEQSSGKHVRHGTYTVTSHLGEGRSGHILRLEDGKGWSLAVKTMGELENKTSEEREEILQELHNEAKMYGLLQELQGKILPRFYCEAFLDDGSYSLIMEELDADTLWDRAPTDEQKVSIVDALRQIHAKGVLHGDIREGNILVDRKGGDKVYFVDLAWSSVCQEDEEFEYEMEQLRALLQELQ